MNESTSISTVRLTLSQVARGVGTSPQNLHKTYIKKGVLSVKRDELNKPYVDFVEALRVFGSRFRLPNESGAVETVDGLESNKKVETVLVGLNELKAENEVLKARTEAAELAAKEARERERESQAREAWLMAQVEKLTDTIKLIEGPKVVQEGQKSGDRNEKKPGWLSRLFGG